MTVLRVDGTAIAALGADLTRLAGVLRGLGELGPTGWAFGDTSVAAALDTVLGNWTYTRTALATSLTELGEVAGTAGAAYLDVEAAVLTTMPGVTR
jgi:hypothetical protein